MADQRYPNLFLIGAPKCGTTSMSYYLSKHTAIFMTSSIGCKEPSFFAPDYHVPWRIGDPDEYLSLFTDANGDAKYLGEATTAYLWSKYAVQNILNSCPDPRFIVMLRNPVDLVISLHSQRVKDGQELVADFEKAWQLQDDRANGRFLPFPFTDSTIFQYYQFAELGKQMKRLYESVDRSHVHCIIYDDFVSDSKKSFRQTLDFLQLPYEGEIVFEDMNPSGVYRWPHLESILHKAWQIRTQLGLPGGFGVHKMIQRINTRPGKQPVRKEFRGELRSYFRKDIALLADVLGQDLSAWIE